MSKQQHLKKKLSITEKGHKHWVNDAEFGAKCPRCDDVLEANDMQSFVESLYEHFIDAHVIGGSFD